MIHFSVAKFKRCLSLLPLFFFHLHLAQPWPLHQNHFTRGMKRRFASTTNSFTRRKCLTLSLWTQTIRRVHTSIRCTTKVGRIRMLHFSCPQYRIFCVCISILKFCASPIESSHTFWSCSVCVLLFSIFRSIALFCLWHLYLAFIRILVDYLVVGGTIGFLKTACASSRQKTKSSLIT